MSVPLPAPKTTTVAQTKITIYPTSEWPAVAPVWAELAHNSTHCTFVLTPEWIECWLEVFSKQLRPDIVLFHADGIIVGACLLVRRLNFAGPFPIRSIYLNAAGEDEADETCVEFNNLLCLPGWVEAVAKALADHLKSVRWDELRLEGFCDGDPLEALIDTFPHLQVSLHKQDTHYVDLADLRSSGRAYETTLGTPTRKHLRQNLTRYRRMGDLRLTVAQDSDAAIAMLDQLADLHQRRWTSRGHPGVFASPKFVAFHRAFIRRAFSSGAIQMMQLCAGESTVGCLYNVVHRGSVYSYQGGFCYGPSPRFSPGIVSHFHAVQYNLSAGMQLYDFMAGDSEYKKSLSTHRRHLTRVTLRKPRLRFAAAERMSPAWKAAKSFLQLERTAGRTINKPSV